MIRRALHAWAGGLPRAFWSIFAGTVINRVGTFVEPFLALYLTSSRDLSPARAGTVVALVGAGSIISQPLGGALADRVGRRPTLTGGMVASGLAIAALALARPLWQLALCALLVGIVGDIYRPAAQATVADVVPIGDRRRASGLIFWAVNFGFSIAAVGGGLLATHGYGLLFAIDALTCGAYAAVVWVTVAETRPAAAAHHTGPGFGVVLRDRLALSYFGLNISIMTVYATIFTILPLAMQADGHSAAEYGAVIALNGLGIVVLQPLISGRLLRLTPAVNVAGGAALMGGAMLVVAASDGLAGYVAAIGLVTVGEIANATAGPGLVAEIAPPALRGRYAGAFGLTFGVAFVITPLLGGRLLGDGGSAAPWLVAAGVAVASTAAMLALGPAIEARRALARQEALVAV
ncbi:MAG TPA: MFS transporter [Baekduia sp.]